MLNKTMLSHQFWLCGASQTLAVDEWSVILHANQEIFEGSSPENPCHGGWEQGLAMIQRMINH